MPVFLCAGLSHKQVPIGVREQLAVSSEQLPERLARLKALSGTREALLLSTCNRLEVFAIVDARAAADDVLRDLGPLAAEHAVTRFEDDALLRGRGRFLDDIKLAGMSHVCFLRSEYAHALVTRLDVSAARALPGAPIRAAAGTVCLISSMLPAPIRRASQAAMLSDVTCHD